MAMWDPWHDDWRPSQLDDPPVAQVAAVSSDEDSTPPPTPWSGLTRHFCATLSVRQVAEALFGQSVLAPGVIRIINGAGEVLHPTTLLSNMQLPRMLYFETGDLGQYNHISQIIQDASHDANLSRAEEIRLQLVTVRVFSSYVPVFRLIDQYQRLNQQLWNRIVDLEQTITQLRAQLDALHVRVNATEPILEEY